MIKKEYTREYYLEMWGESLSAGKVSKIKNYLFSLVERQEFFLYYNEILLILSCLNFSILPYNQQKTFSNFAKKLEININL